MLITQIQVGTRDYEAMIDLRMKVLLDPVGIPRTYINPKKEKEDILIGAFENGQLIGCCILSHVDAETLQLRQMAVENAIQEKGIGTAIIKYSEEIVSAKGYKKLMMHARDSVLGFYKKCGYAVAGEQFFEVGIGHHKMEKAIV